MMAMRMRPFVHASVVAVSLDRKSTRLNSSHVEISYAVFCLKKKHHGALDPAVLAAKTRPESSLTSGYARAAPHLVCFIALSGIVSEVEYSLEALGRRRDLDAAGGRGRRGLRRRGP